MAMPSTTTWQSGDSTLAALALFSHVIFGLHFLNSGSAFLFVGSWQWINLGLAGMLHQLSTLTAGFVTLVCHVVG